ncbi:hypothetical protein MMC30_008973 [Trapelia coarctata]|nr:hypothetical protein [Trapelia coarctata]
MAPTTPSVSQILPPLILGTATFNNQYNPDPYALPTTGIVHRALSLGVRAFDTSPYYGPAEDLVGQALDTRFVHENFPRNDYYLLTKVGRIAGSQFNYSAPWVRESVERSLKRLRTDYLDVVYCHDVEFVTPEEVLEAVTELRRIRDESGKVKYVGISGYPVVVLSELAEMILEKTGEPLDIVMSYANYTVQNTRLSSIALPRLKAAGVDVVANASVLGMGLLRSNGVPVGAQGDWHPSPNDLRAAIEKASAYCDSLGEKIEKVAIRWGLESWIHEGRTVGSKGDPASGIPWRRKSIEEIGGAKLGVSVMGVSKVEELDETMQVWRSILDGLEDGEKTATASGRGISEREWSLNRQEDVRRAMGRIREVLGKWVDFAWASPGPEYVRQKPKTGDVPPLPPTPPE